MRRAIYLIITVIIAVAFTATAQTSKEAFKNVKQQNKYSRELLNTKPGKDAKKQAKKLKKEGWHESAGALSMEKQIDKSMLMTAEVDNDGYPAWFVGEATTVGENADGARIQAIELAKLNIVQQLEQEIAMGIENAVGNQQLSAQEAATATKTVVNSRSVMKQKLASVRPVVVLYRTLPNKNTDVMVRIFYSRTDMKNQLRAVLREELLNESKELGDKVDCIINGICPLPVKN
ncbi:MAG: hypothetical protein K2H46_10735 [Muribaculaceae bacterium]|nr:hypothetical protein [Muribaculaceae bacterium]